MLLVPSLLAQACTSVASMKGIQTLDLSGNRLSVAGATELAKALCRCRSLHEIVLEESVDVKDAPLVRACSCWCCWCRFAVAIAVDVIAVGVGVHIR